MDARIRRLCPDIKSDEYGDESPVSVHYNCIAFAVGETEVWYQPPSENDELLPGPPPKYRWLEGVPNDAEVNSYVKFFERFEYVECDNGNLETGFEKIAIYSNYTYSFEFHAARQLENGWWASKFGNGKDLEHKTAESIVSWRQYRWEKWMKRPRR